MSNALRSLVIIDDNETDAAVLRVVIERAGARNPLHVFTKADDAVAFLTSLTDTQSPLDSALPLACFIDVKMTGLSGLELIEWVRNHEIFSRMALIAVSASENPQDVAAAAKLGAQCFVAKFPPPAVLRELIAAAEEVSPSAASTAFLVSANLFRGRAALPTAGGELTIG